MKIVVRFQRSNIVVKDFNIFTNVRINYKYIWNLITNMKWYIDDDDDDDDDDDGDDDGDGDGGDDDDADDNARHKDNI